jgi:hypothetical protein
MKRDFYTFGKSIPFLIYIIAGILCFPFFMYQINPDGVCYISIAKNYAAGNFHDAINGYWSPLISWVMAPFLSMGFDALITFKVINLIIGLGCLFQLAKVVDKLIPDEKVKGLNVLIVSSFSLAIADCALSVITPDLLASFILLIYINLILEKKILKYKILLAFIGALMFLAKAYFFWFFIVHLATYIIFSRVSSSSNKSIKSYLLIAFFFLLIIMPWELALYSKYDKLVISLAAKYDHAMMATGKLVNTYENELTGIPNKNAVSAWEDISLVYNYEDWSTFESIENLSRQLGFGLNYIKDFLLYIIIWPILLVSIIGSLIYIFYKRKIKQISSDPVFEIFTLSVIYTGGYAAFFFEPRYLWGILFMNLIIAYYFLNKISVSLSFSRLRRYTLFACVFILINIPPLKEIKGFIINVPGKIEKTHSEELKQIIPKGSNVASYSFGEARYVSYYLGLHDFGGICNYNDEEKLKSDLAKFSIDFIIMANNEYKAIPVNSKIIKTTDFKVYDIRELSN